MKRRTGRILAVLALLSAVTTMAVGSQDTRQKCLDECKQNYFDRIKICDDLYNSKGSAHYHNSEWHKTCLSEAKTNYDNCRSTCD